LKEKTLSLDSKKTKKLKWNLILFI
jgi:hypothetical protein